MKKFWIAVLARNTILSLGLSVCSTVALALPSIEQVDPARTADELQQLIPEETESPLKIQVPRLETDVSPSLEIDNIRFTLKKIVLTGNTIYSTQDLQHLYQDKLGKNVSILDLHKIARSISGYYRENGYILTQVIIPPQDIDGDGIVTMEVIEGYIDDVSIQGEVSPQVCKLLLGYIDQIKKNNPLNIKILERYSLLADDIPGLEIKVILTKSKAPGASDLVFDVKEQRFNHFLSVNNYNSELLGRNQLVAGVGVNNLYMGSQTNFNAIVGTTIKRLKYFAAHHKQEINYDGLQWNSVLSYTKTEPTFAGLNSTFLSTPGEANYFNTNLIYPLIRSRKQNLRFLAGFNYMNSHTDAMGMILFRDWIRSLELKGMYDWRGYLDSINEVGLEFTQGLNILGAKANPPTRPGGKTSFSKVQLAGARYQPIIGNFSSLFRAKSQYSFNQLLSAEKFGYGGGPYGYGYDPSEITGDYGLAGLFEIQYNQRMSSNMRARLQVFVGSDAGVIWNRNSTFEPARQARIAASSGLRILPTKEVSIEVFMAKPFKRLSTTGKKNIRVYFNVLYRA